VATEFPGQNTGKQPPQLCSCWGGFVPSPPCAETPAPLHARVAGQDVAHVPTSPWHVLLPSATSQRRDARGKKHKGRSPSKAGGSSCSQHPQPRVQGSPPAPRHPLPPHLLPSPLLLFSQAAPFPFLISSQHVSKATHCDGKKSPSSEIIARPPDVGVGCETDLPPPPPPLARPPWPL